MPVQKDAEPRQVSHDSIECPNGLPSSRDGADKKTDLCSQLVESPDCLSIGMSPDRADLEGS